MSHHLDHSDDVENLFPEDSGFYWDETPFTDSREPAVEAPTEDSHEEQQHDHLRALMAQKGGGMDVYQGIQDVSGVQEGEPDPFSWHESDLWPQGSGETYIPAVGTPNEDFLAEAQEGSLGLALEKRRLEVLVETRAESIANLLRQVLTSETEAKRETAMEGIKAILDQTVHEINQSFDALKISGERKQAERESVIGGLLFIVEGLENPGLVEHIEKLAA